MKQYLTVDDVKALTDSQKQILNSMWLPAKYDHAVVSICKDAENDIYEDLEFVVGDIILERNGANIVLRRLRLVEEVIPEELSEDSEDAETETENEEEFDMDFNDPGDYFQKEVCLPLLSIGQLISLLRKTKAGQNGFSIGIPPLNDEEQGFTLDDRFGEVDKNEELTVLLFDMLKTMM